MGLAGPRKRRKIGHDPNNTAWSRSDSGYGQKILSAQGWTPGSYLGAKDAPQSAHFTQANASHIRILLKDDNLGLGAERGKAEGENFGLASLSDLYGRLNGKGDVQLAKDQKHRTDVKRILYADKKWGALRFVKGGVLVGDSIESMSLEEAQGIDQSTPNASSVPTVDAVQRDVSLEKTAPDEDVSQRSESEENNIDHPKNRTRSPGEPNRKSKKERKRKSKTTEEEEGVMDKSLARAERKARRRQRRLEKAAASETDMKDQTFAGNPETPPPSKGPLGNEEHEKGDMDDTAEQIADRPFNPRLAVRQRFINQKKMSSMNAQALKEILMVKS